MWAFSVLGIPGHLIEMFYERLLWQLGSCNLQDLLLLSWGSVEISSAGSCLKVQEAAACRVLQAVQAGACFPAFAERALGVVWAWNFAGILGSRLLSATTQVIRHGAAQLDEEMGTSILPRRRAEAKDAFLKVGLADPSVILDLADILVVFKPPGWEVYNGMVESQLTDFLRSLQRGQVPILDDDAHGCGFLHRLDVPSSGLLLAATSYQAWYELQLQLVSGSITREYLVLCHGWIPAARRSISACLRYVDDASVSSGHLGKPSSTCLKVVAHSMCSHMAMSLTAMQILTGRMHQIRSHMAHVGHPTVHDGKYASRATVLKDAQVCTRNFLHRYHLTFRDTAGAGRGAWHWLPPDLVEALKHLSPNGGTSQEVWQSWQHGHLDAFEDLGALERLCAHSR